MRKKIAISIIYIVVIIFINFPENLLGQKRIIDSSSFSNWQYIGYSPLITNNGKFIFYSVINKPVGSSSLVIKNLVDGSEVEYPNLQILNIKLTEDSKRALIKKGDTLNLMTLENKEFIPLARVIKYNLFNVGRKELLCYQIKESQNFVIYDLTNEKKNVYDNVVNYWVSLSGKEIVIQKKLPRDTSNSIYYMSLQDMNLVPIYRGVINELTFDNSGGQVAFYISEQRGGEVFSKIGYYKKGMSNAYIIGNNLDNNKCQNKVINGINRFSADGKRLFISLQDTNKLLPLLDISSVDIWNYKDAILQSEQLDRGNINNYTGVIDLEDRKIIQLNYSEEELISGEGLDCQDSIWLLKYQKGKFTEEHWNHMAKSEYYLINTNNGHRERIYKNWRNATFSNTGRYICGLDSVLGNIYCYDIKDRIQQNISSLIPLHKDDLNEFGLPINKFNHGLEIASWLPKDNGLIIYDKYDIWLIDPECMVPPINLTNNFGRINNVQLRFIASNGNSKTKLDFNHDYILKGVNVVTKEEGFYHITLKRKPTSPRLLSKGNYHYEVPYGGSPFIKAENTSDYFLLRCSTTESYNIIHTRDFIKFNQITNISPERNWNWIKSELMKWNSPNGDQLQGVLYKPENFDSTQKYPIIFTFYERMSQELNQYYVPSESSTLLNIPWFVSRGYLIFAPDIKYKIGYPGKSALDALVSAAKYVGAFPYIDTAKMGLQGFSFSGYETNYIITQTGLFAAAVSGAGMTDLISDYGSVMGQQGISSQELYEVTQMRIGHSLWEQPELYFQNSPVLFADRITTPVLLVHGKKDGIVPSSQALEFFTSLRRLKKKAWLLLYDNSGHHIVGKDAFDYTIRMTQFFDYYLKDSIPRKWMTNGIPAKFKGMETGLEADSSGMIP